MMNRICFRHLLMLASFLFIITTLQGQGTFKGAAIVGVNLAQIDGDNLTGFNSIGLHAGGRVKVDFTERWSVNMEMLFSQHGSRRNNNDQPGGLDKIRLNYVEVPVYVSFTDWKVQANAGISYGRLINFEVTDNFGEDISDLQQYDPNTYFYFFGGVFNFSDQIGMELRWAKAFNDIQEDGGANQIVGRLITLRGIYTF